jgi:hypothetical protein
MLQNIDDNLDDDDDNDDDEEETKSAPSNGHAKGILVAETSIPLGHTERT